MLDNRIVVGESDTSECFPSLLRIVPVSRAEGAHPSGIQTSCGQKVFRKQFNVGLRHDVPTENGAAGHGWFGVRLKTASAFGKNSFHFVVAGKPDLAKGWRMNT